MVSARQHLGAGLVLLLLLAGSPWATARMLAQVNPGVISAVAEASGLVESSTRLDGFEATSLVPQAAEAVTAAATVVEDSDITEQEPEGRVQETAAVAPIGTQASTTPSVLDLTATNTNSGKTPAIIGVNLGHRYPGSNWPLWMQRLGVNGARAFLTSLWGSSLQSFVGGSSAWGNSLQGTPVTNLTAFQAAVAELRSPAGHDPAQSSKFRFPVRWDKFDTKWSTTDVSNKADEQEGNHNATLATLRQIPGMGPPLVVISCGLGSVRNGTLLDNTTGDYWRSHWEVYKHFYAFSRYLWMRGVNRIELYNEPDLDNDFALPGTTGGFNNALWVDTMAVRSRAIQDLYADLNREDSILPDLTPDVHVGAYAKTTYGGGNMGQPAVQAMHQTFATAVNPDPAWFNLQTYSYHSYGQTGKTILSNFNTLLSASASDRAAQGQFPFSLTEFNAKTSGDFASTTLNMDAPSEAIKLASQAINLATAGASLTSLYVFKFSVTLSSGSNGVTKNGIHWGDNTAAPYNIADTTLGAEAIRLIAEKLSGAKNILQMTSLNAASFPDTQTIAVRDGPAYYVYVVNTGTGSVTASLSLSTWLSGIAGGVPVVVDKVTASMSGEVESVTPTTGALSVAVGNNTLVRFTIPATSATLRNISAVQAGQVRASTLSATNYNSSVTMCVGTHSTTHTNTYATAMRFSVSNPANITYAVVRLTVSSVSASQTTSMPLLLLAIRDNTWTSANVTWNALAGPGSGPLLPHPPTASGWVVNSVARNFINWNSTGIQIAGHVTIPPVTTTGAADMVKMVDVTSIVKASNGNVAFLLVRPFRRNQEAASGDIIAADTLNGGANVCFHSLAAATVSNRPRLLVY